MCFIQQRDKSSGPRSGGCYTEDWVEFNAPLDTIDVVSEVEVQKGSVVKVVVQLTVSDQREARG